MSRSDINLLRLTERFWAKKKRPERMRRAPNQIVLMWSRGESNPCPNKVTIGLLHVYCFIICRQSAGKTQTN